MVDGLPPLGDRPRREPQQWPERIGSVFLPAYITLAGIGLIALTVWVALRLFS